MSSTLANGCKSRSSPGVSATVFTPIPRSIATFLPSASAYCGATTSTNPVCVNTGGQRVGDARAVDSASHHDDVGRVGHVAPHEDAARSRIPYHVLSLEGCFTSGLLRCSQR